MDCKSFPFDKLPFSDLFHSYINGSGKIDSFFEALPFDESSVKTLLENYTFSGNRDRTADELRQFNRQFDCSEKTLQQIEKLRDPGSFTIVTGQQLTLFGGPLFTIYKLLTAIVYASRWESLYQHTFIPVFWLADEDHDFIEATTIGVLSDDEFTSISYQGRDNNDPVGRQVFDDELKKAINQLMSSLPDTDFSQDLFDLVNMYYKTGSTFRQGFGSLLLKLFGKHGLILAGSDDTGIKNLLTDPLKQAIQYQADVYKSLDGQSNKLEKSGFNRQASVQNSNIFYIDPQNGRSKIDFSNNCWQTANGHSWSSEELIEQIDRHPETVSPNVFLRPVLQDRLLPTAAYIAGPGEIAYYSQMKEMYKIFGQTMPVIIPRFSATIIEPPIARIMDRLPFTLADYSQRTEELEFQILDSDKKQQVEQLFSDWKESTNDISAKIINQIQTLDPTLKKSADKAVTQFENELNRLKGKVYKSLKRDEEVQLERLRRIQMNLFPNSNLQEREVAFLTFMNKYGLDIWDSVLDCLSDTVPDSHKLIYL